MNVIIVGYVHTLLPWMPSRTVYKAINVGNYCGVGLVGVKLSKQPKGNLPFLVCHKPEESAILLSIHISLLVFYPFSSPLIKPVNKMFDLTIPNLFIY